MYWSSSSSSCARPRHSFLYQRFVSTVPPLQDNGAARYQPSLHQAQITYATQEAPSRYVHLTQHPQAYATAQQHASHASQRPRQSASSLLQQLHLHQVRIMVVVADLLLCDSCSTLVAAYTACSACSLDNACRLDKLDVGSCVCIEFRGDATRGCHSVSVFCCAERF